jgi:hypothetical protein
MRMIHSNLSFILACLLCLVTISLKAQYQNVRIDKGKGGLFTPCEPTIAIDPSNNDRMVIGAMVDRVSYSQNAGRKWRTRTLKSGFGVFGDPHVIADEGSFYYFHLSDPEQTGWSGKMVLDRIVCQKTFNGKKWNGGAYTAHNPPNQHDRPSAVFDPHSGNIYLVWIQYDRFGSQDPGHQSNIMFSYSDDRGRTWQPPSRINELSGSCLGDESTVSNPTITASADGSICVVWTLNDKIFFDRSDDGGISWLRNDILLVDIPGGTRYSIPEFGKATCYPVIDCDRSEGRYSGNLYVSWSDQRNGDFDTDVWLIRSENGGNTWSPPVKINNDPPGNHQFFSWFTVDQKTGYLYSVFYDRRNLEGALTNVFLGFSEDGGSTFRNEKVSAKPFETDPDIFVGDKIDISAFNNKVRPVWTQVEDRSLSIWTAIIDF